jgi:ribosomal protein L40E
MRLWICKCGWRNPAHVVYCRGCSGYYYWRQHVESHTDGRPSPKTRKRKAVKP